MEQYNKRDSENKKKRSKDPVDLVQEDSSSHMFEIYKTVVARQTTLQVTVKIQSNTKCRIRSIYCKASESL